MSFRLSILALLSLTLAACNGGSSGGSALVNLGISASGIVGEGELRALRVGEAGEANTDLNGDGDANDLVLFVYDHASGASVNLELALGLPTVCVAGDVLIAFGVPEADQGGTDLNFDGDTSDVVLHVYDHRTGVATSTGHATANFVPPAIGLGLVGFAVPEAADGNQDHDGDGKTESAVLHVYDSRTLVTTNGGRQVDHGLMFHHHQFAFVTDEEFSGDLNGDGDAIDRVFQLFDSVTGGVISVPLAVAGEAIATRTEDWYLLASELMQGLDLNGDGDTDDGAYQLIEPHLETIDPLGLSASNTFGLNTSNDTFAALVVQEIDGLDRNGDGDMLDAFVVIYDPASDQVFDPALPIASGKPVFLGDRVALVVDEDSQGEDLNGDGDQLDRIVHVLDPVLETSTNLGFDGVELSEAGGMLVVSRDEPIAGADWNGDGDQDDRVLFVWDPATGQLDGTDVASFSVEASNDESILFTVFEPNDGRDRNGDGDIDDFVYTLYDLQAHRTRGLGVAGAQSAGGLFEGGGGVLLVSEAGEGRDMNGDGDELDFVLHRLR